LDDEQTKHDNPRADERELEHGERSIEASPYKVSLA
jgi:hypothetical protein